MNHLEPLEIFPSQILIGITFEDPWIHSVVLIVVVSKQQLHEVSFHVSRDCGRGSSSCSGSHRPVRSLLRNSFGILSRKQVCTIWFGNPICDNRGSSTPEEMQAWFYRETQTKWRHIILLSWCAAVFNECLILDLSLLTLLTSLADEGINHTSCGGMNCGEIGLETS